MTAIDVRQVPLALYVHLPWCVRKCPYCDFNSHAVPVAGVPEQAYLDALRQDLEFAAHGTGGREIVSVFFGGGTPSLFAARSIGQLLDHARALLPFAPHAEITLEANPGTIERGRFADYAAAGINRVSLGAQTFDPARLVILGRIHSADEIELAVADLRASGIDNFNLDLMYALPGQSADEALADIERAIALAPAHLSHYQLTLEPGTPFARHPPRGIPDHDSAFAMQETCQARLAAAGYVQYEVSAYAREERFCAHNLVYWRFGDYLGIGAGAHGKLTRAGGAGIERTVRVRHPARYLAASEPGERVAETRLVDAKDTPFEFCLNALRLVEGFTDELFERRTGLRINYLAQRLEVAVARGLLERRDRSWRATPRGRLFLNDLQALFLPS